MTSIVASSVMQRQMTLFGNTMNDWYALFDKDAIFAWSYLEEFGMKGCLEGRREIEDATQAFLNNFAEMRFLKSSVFEAQDQDMVFAEYEMDVRLRSEATWLRHSYSSRMIVSGHRIVFLRHCLASYPVPPPTDYMRRRD